ncbi:MAG: RNA polymerase sigma factor [Patescibacteria group bacterium]|jgi:RNA polymerase sigma-70 factor (ECF subfamily)|nr:RNA polymerase sigma factor [Patescibacteria group bacterium]
MSKDNKNFLANYNKYVDKIYAYIWYRVGFDKTTAEDLCSEIFLKAFKSHDSFDETRSFQSWIYRIAKNHLLNHYRTRGREVDLESALDLSVETLQKINTSIEVERIMKHIGKLDDYSREVVIMRYVDELDNKEIAEILDKEVNAVRVQLNRALNKLREDIE